MFSYLKKLFYKDNKLISSSLKLNTSTDRSLKSHPVWQARAGF